jgi:hypothetical protein
LRVDIDALEVLDLHAFLRGLVDMAEHQKEIPEIHPDLHAVGVAFAVIGRFLEYNPGLGRCHRPTWYRRRKSAGHKGRSLRNSTSVRA